MTADKPPNTTRLCRLRNKASSTTADRVQCYSGNTAQRGKKKKKRRRLNKEVQARVAFAPSAFTPKSLKREAKWHTNVSNYAFTPLLLQNGAYCMRSASGHS
jgi:hypothetical protein